MSARLLGLAFDAEAPSAAAKLVLIKLVDCCDDEGKKIFPAVATLARAAQCDVRSVQRHIRLFCTVGLLKCVRAGGAGPKHTSHYEMNISVLRLIVEKGWSAVACGACAPANDEGEDGADAACHAESAEPNAEIAPNKGDTMSPLETVRVTRETDKGDTGVTQTLKNNPQEFERERERANAGMGASSCNAGSDANAGLPGDEPAPDHPHLESFVAIWPTRAVDDQARVQSAWGALSLEDRRAAIAGVEPFLAELKKAKRSLVPAGWKYLSERRWSLLPEMKKSVDAQAFTSLKPFTKGWWALFHRFRDGAGNARLLLSLADQGREYSCRQADLAAAVPEALRQFPAHGETAQAFLAKARRAGLHFPSFRPDAWIFLREADASAVERDELNERALG